VQEREKGELFERCCEEKRPQDLKTLPVAGRGWMERKNKNRKEMKKIKYERDKVKNGKR
jgi:hypothetical protein